MSHDDGWKKVAVNVWLVGGGWKKVLKAGKLMQEARTQRARRLFLFSEIKEREQSSLAASREELERNSQGNAEKRRKRSLLPI